MVAKVVGRALLEVARIAVKMTGVTITYGSYAQTGGVTRAELCTEPQST